MSRCPHGCHHSRAGESAPAYHGHNRFSTDSSRHRRRVASGALAAQQPASVRSIALSGRAVASLVVTTINMPHRERRCQPSAQQSRILSAVCA
jgi:hypothetical protein